MLPCYWHHNTRHPWRHSKAFCTSTFIFSILSPAASFKRNGEHLDPTFLDAAGFSGQQFRRLVRSHFAGSWPPITRFQREMSWWGKRLAAFSSKLQIDSSIDQLFWWRWGRSTAIAAATPPPLPAPTPKADIPKLDAPKTVTTLMGGRGYINWRRVAVEKQRTSALAQINNYDAFLVIWEMKL